MAHERYLEQARALGIGPDHAAEVLREVQGPRAGSTATEAERQAAMRALQAGPPGEPGRNPDPLLTLAQAAQYLGTSTRMPRRLQQERRVPFVKVGRHVRFRVSALETYLAQRVVPAAPDADGGDGPPED
ncbi:excisionase family DNA-binding protein [Streptomyces sp. NPDC051546]|uniref:excisionase family DNA-binding protein n=1 Tax=Streptomyces sp. NPDC051546 TaxID=3365655 RepID=UPI00379A6281